MLEIAQRLGKLLESRLGADVILTRNDDNYIPLDERAGIANQSQADFFISVHANYSDLPSARGVETYYTNFFSAAQCERRQETPGTPGQPESAAACCRRSNSTKRLNSRGISQPACNARSTEPCQRKIPVCAIAE